MNGHICVDFDGTLAYHHSCGDSGHADGEPILLMVKRVKDWLAAGIEVRIFTARVGPQDDPNGAALARAGIEQWCVQHLGRKLSVTATKDYATLQLWDDKAVSVVPNTGLTAVEMERALVWRYRSALEIVRADTALHAGCGPTYQAVCEVLK